MLKGNLEIVNLREIVGWAQDDSQPDAPIELSIGRNNELLGRVVANRYRADLEKAGIGDGRCGFGFQFPEGLAPFERHVVRVYRQSDGQDLAQSPVTLEPSQAFDAAAREAFVDIMQRFGSDQDIVAKIDFLVDQVEKLFDQLNYRDNKRVDRYGHFLKRWRTAPQD